VPVDDHIYYELCMCVVAVIRISYTLFNILCDFAASPRLEETA